MKRTLLTAVCFGIALAGGLAVAADDANQKAIKARRGAMQIRSFNAGPLFAMAKGEMDYDAKLAATLANNLKMEAEMDGGRMWPKGSDAMAYHGDTRAKTEIWSTYPEIGEKGKAYKEAVMKLASSAGSGLDALKSGASDLGKACKGCHDDFRNKEF